MPNVFNMGNAVKRLIWTRVAVKRTPGHVARSETLAFDCH
jgi:hypothetical protein